jgi:hypothetical protein
MLRDVAAWYGREAASADRDENAMPITSVTAAICPYLRACVRRRTPD